MTATAQRAAAPGKRSRWRIVLMLCAAAFAAHAVHAHHSWARYDGDRIVTLTGVLTEVEWASPHVVMRFTVTDERGENVGWTMEMDPPTLLNRYGLRHDALAAGMHVKITCVQARTGAPVVRALMIETQDGTVYRVSSRV